MVISVTSGSLTPIYLDAVPLGPLEILEIRPRCVAGASEVVFVRDAQIHCWIGGCLVWSSLADLYRHKIFLLLA